MNDVLECETVPTSRVKMSRNENSCCACGGSLKDGNQGHPFACSHVLCSSCVEVFGDCTLRSVCFSCKSPEVDLPEEAIWSNEGSKEIPKSRLIGLNAEIIDIKSSKNSKSSPIIYDRKILRSDDLEKPFLKVNADVIVTSQRRHSPMDGGAYPELQRFLRSMEEKREEMEKNRAGFEKRMEDVRKAIAKHAQMCRSLIDHDENLLLQQLEEMRASTLRDSSAMRDGIGSVIERAEALVAGGATEAEVEQLFSARVNVVPFQSAELELYNIRPIDGKNAVGELSFQNISDDSCFLSVPVLIGSIEGNFNPVTGISVLDRKIYVCNDTDPEIFVFQLGTLDHLPSISLLHLLEPIQVPSVLDLAVCATNRCLYALDFKNSYVYRLNPDDGHLLSWWSVKTPHNLSVTARGSVLVTSEKRIFEYDPSGKTIRTISNSLLAPIRSSNRPAIKYPRHVIEVDDGQVVVADFQNQQTPHVVYEVDRKGTVSRWHGNAPASGADGFNEPRHLAVAVSGHVIVSDRRNERVLLLDESLKFVKDLVTSENAGVAIESPIRLFLDRARGHLYVGQSNGVTLIFRVLL